MKINARITQVLPIQTGTGQNGDWTKLSFIVSVDFSGRPVDICIVSWGDRIKQDHLIVGNNVEIDIEIKSREYNGKWYTDVIGQELKEIDSVQKNDMSVAYPKERDQHTEKDNETELPF